MKGIDSLGLRIFSCFSSVVERKLNVVVRSMLAVCSANTETIAGEMARQNGGRFDASLVALYRLLAGKGKNVFVVGERLWRAYLSFIFAILEEQKLVKKGRNLAISVDFTSNKDNFSGKMILASFGISLRSIF